MDAYMSREEFEERVPQIMANLLAELGETIVCVDADYENQHIVATVKEDGEYNCEIGGIHVVYQKYLPPIPLSPDGSIIPHFMKDPSER